MKKKSVLIVDDEKNIRLTLTQTLETMDIETGTAINGEEALSKLKDREYDLILLDLKMPGMDGMDVLRRVVEIRPDIRIIIITAHGTIESAVEAMKLGAVDFIQKPFAPKEIREIVTQVIDREKVDVKKATDYSTRLELAKRCINEKQFEAAIEHIKKAVSLDTSRPEAFNLLGALHEIRGDKYEAQNYYRAALDLDSSYKPAIDNLHRTTLWNAEGEVIFGDISKSLNDNHKKKKKDSKNK